MFKVGDRVRCIDNTGVASALSIDNIYTVDYIIIKEGLSPRIVVKEIHYGDYFMKRFVLDKKLPRNYKPKENV